MTFEEWFEAEGKWGATQFVPQGSFKLEVSEDGDYYHVIKQAYKAGYLSGHNDGYVYRETVYKAQEGNS